MVSEVKGKKNMQASTFEADNKAIRKQKSQKHKQWHKHA